ncbi:MAG: cell division protein FtsZ, partial [Sphingobacterium sp.]
ELSPIPNKVQLGISLTEGMGAGADPDVGENSAIESIEDVKRMLGTNTKMLFITAGMGGGTGTGASPVLAKAAKELGILTVAIITTPFTFEGKRRRMQAEDGLEELRKYVDSYLVISNDRLREIFGNLTMTAAFAKADDILTTAAKGIAEIITIPGYVNVDFKDVRTVMNDSGVAIMGNAVSKGEQRALEAVTGALASPLLKDNEIEGARYILLNITSGTREVTMDEVAIITDYIQEKAGLSADLIWGNCIDQNYEDELSVTIIATGFQTAEQRVKEKEKEKIAIPLTPDVQTSVFVKPVATNQFADRTADSNNFVKPTVQAEESTNNTSQTDLFSNKASVASQVAAIESSEQKVIRHTLEFESAAEQEEVEEDKNPHGFELKTSPSMFEFKLPTVFDVYQST